MIVPGVLISLLTFPGVIVHEFAHVVFCKLTNTPVLEVCYFRVGNPAGYVIHGQPSSVWRHILIGVGPLFVNTSIGLALGIVAMLINVDPDHVTQVGGILLWLGISIAMHSFPSTGDATSIWTALWAEGSPITARIIGSPIVAIIYLGAFCSVFWLDAVYGASVVLGIPRLIMH